MERKFGDGNPTRRGIIVGAGATAAALFVAGDFHADTSPSADAVAAGTLQGDGVQRSVTVVNAAFNVQDSAFGARGDGHGDDTQAIQSALTQAGDAGGGIVFLPAGAYSVSAPLTVPAGVHVVGASKFGAKITTTSATADILTLNHASGLSNLHVSAAVTRTAGSTVAILGNSAFIDNCDLSGYFVGVSVGVRGALQAVGARMSNINFVAPSLSDGGGAIHCVFFSNFIITACVIAGPDSGTQPSFGIRVHQGDTGFISDTNITRHGRALAIDLPIGQNCYVSNSLFDSAGTTALGRSASCAQLSPSGGLFDTKFSNCWFGLSIADSGCEVSPTDSGVVDGLTFTGCEFVGNAASGLLCLGANVRNWAVTGGFSAGNARSGITAAGGSGSFTITGHRAGPAADRGPNAVGIDAGTGDNYVVVGNNLTGNLIAPFASAAVAINTVVANNLL
jgi:hypothetical protein